jgi:ATP-binding cassette, subfamily B, multidrug efflux pump
VLVRLAKDRLRGWLPAVGVLVVLQAVQIAGTLALPTLGAAVIDDGVLRRDGDRIATLGAVMVAVAVVQVVAALVAAGLAAHVSTGMGRDLRAAVFSRVLDLSGREVARFGTASLVARTVNDVTQVQNLARSGLGVLVSAPLMCLGSVVLALSLDVPMAALLVGMVLVVAVGFGLLLARMAAVYGRMQVALDRLGVLLREAISGVRVLRSFVSDDREIARFADRNDDFLDLSRRAGRLIASMLPLVLLILNLATVALLWVGAHRIAAGATPVGTLSALLSYLALILMSVVMLAFVLLAVPRARVCAGRIQEILDCEPGARPPAAPVGLRTRPGRVELRGVEFRYPGAERAVLHDVDLVLEPGERVAVLGGTGSGKSTLVDLLVRASDPTAGEVLVGGTDLRDLDPALLAATVGVVPQRPFLFSGTVAEALRFGHPDADDAELWEALRVARADEFVARMPGGLDAPLAQGGRNVSGGQRQRLCLARTLLRRPAVYLFDDCFSALDQVTEREVRAAVAERTAGATVLVVAQRIAAARDADRIVVLDAGRVVATGTHRTLLATSGTYREIARSQAVEAAVEDRVEDTVGNAAEDAAEDAMEEVGR